MLLKFWTLFSIVWGSLSVNLLNVLPKINRYWTTFETLAEFERDCKERQLKAWGIVDARILGHVVTLANPFTDTTYTTLNQPWPNVNSQWRPCFKETESRAWEKHTVARLLRLPPAQRVHKSTAQNKRPQLSTYMFEKSFRMKCQQQW